MDGTVLPKGPPWWCCRGQALLISSTSFRSQAGSVWLPRIEPPRICLGNRDAREGCWSALWDQEEPPGPGELRSSQDPGFYPASSHSEAIQARPCGSLSSIFLPGSADRLPLLAHQHMLLK